MSRSSESAFELEDAPLAPDAPGLGLFDASELGQIDTKLLLTVRLANENTTKADATTVAMVPNAGKHAVQRCDRDLP